MPKRLPYKFHCYPTFADIDESRKFYNPELSYFPLNNEDPLISKWGDLISKLTSSHAPEVAADFRDWIRYFGIPHDSPDIQHHLEFFCMTLWVKKGQKLY